MKQYEVRLADGSREIVSAGGYYESAHYLEFTAEGSQVACFGHAQVVSVVEMRAPEMPPVDHAERERRLKNAQHYASEWLEGMQWCMNLSGDKVLAYGDFDKVLAGLQEEARDRAPPAWHWTDSYLGPHVPQPRAR
jgi:hypothetical protein